MTVQAFILIYLYTLDMEAIGTGFDLRIAASLELPVSTAPPEFAATERILKRRWSFRHGSLRIDFTKLHHIVASSDADPIHQLEIELVDVQRAVQQSLCVKGMWAEVKALVEALAEAADSQECTVHYKLIKQRMNITTMESMTVSEVQSTRVGNYSMDRINYSHERHIDAQFGQLANAFGTPGPSMIASEDDLMLRTVVLSKCGRISDRVREAEVRDAMRVEEPMLIPTQRETPLTSYLNHSRKACTAVDSIANDRISDPSILLRDPHSAVYQPFFDFRYSLQRPSQSQGSAMQGTTRRVLAGEFAVVNKHLVRELVARGAWTFKLRAEIIANNGSVQGISNVPADLQLLFRCAFELPQRALVDLAVDRGHFVDQSQSLNLLSSKK
ncbi:ribonucleotide reductase [Pavlovales sp. CCMP2436]|nr:ribonucleotide reductase [Pavlovales sp. CCMP2436]